MAGKTNLTFTTFSAKKLLSKANTSMAASDNEEIIGSAVQLGAETIFGDSIPSSPSKNLYSVQTGSGGKPAVEYVEFELSPVNASFYDANSFDSEASAQAAGFHAYIFKMRSDYESNSNNTKKGNGVFDDTIHLTGTLGGLQIVPPSFSLTSPNPYTCTIYSGSRDVEDQISLTDEIDWYVDYYNGILFVQDFDASKVPTRAKAFIYVGDMLKDTIGGGGGGTGVGWIGSGNGGISTTGSLFIGTNSATPANADIFLSNNGAAVFNEQGNNVDFRVESVNRQGALLVDADTNQVLILSGGSANSIDESSGADVAVFVSGTIGSRGTSNKGTALFGGDVAVSGGVYFGEISTPANVPDGSIALYGKDNGSGVTKLYFKHGSTETEVGIATGGTGGGVGWIGTAPSLINTTGSLGVSGSLDVSEFIRHIGDDDTFIQFADDAIGITVGGEQLITVSEAGTDMVTVGDGGDVDFRVRTENDDNTLYIEGSTDRIGIGTNSPSSIVHIKESAPTLTLQRENNSNASTINFVGQNGNTANSVVHDSSTNDLVFKTFNGSAPEEILRIGDHYGTPNRQVIILSGSGMHAAAMQPRETKDIAFFVSGSIGSRGTSVPGTSVFGGDVHISGNIGPLNVGGNVVPTSDRLYDLGSENARFANIYTGDLHLKNERGHWQIVEEREFLTVINRLTGKRYKMVLEPLPDGKEKDEQ